MPVIPSPELPTWLRRDIYLGAVAKAYQPTLEILISSLTVADSKLVRHIHFPFWSIDENAELINWYVTYKPSKYDLWYKIKKFLCLVDTFVAIHFEGSNVTIMSLDWRPEVVKKTFNLADPSSFYAIGQHLFKVLT